MTFSRLSILALVALLVLVQYRLWFEEGGIRDVLSLKKKLAIQTQTNALLKQKNDELLFQIERLEKSEDGVETRARNELGMVKPGETYYQIVK